MKKAPAKYNVPGLERGLQILQLFDRTNRVLTGAQVSRALKIPRTTAFRLAQTLERLGFLEREGDGFRIGPAVMRLGFEYIASLEITELARPVLERLRDESGFSSQLVIRDGRDVVVVLRAASPSMFASNVNIGTRFPAHATILGRTLLCEHSDEELARLFPERALQSHSQSTPKTLVALKALLKEDRARGYAASEGFFERGISAIAAPVRDQGGRIVAAVSITAQRPSLEPKALRERLVRQVRDAAAELSHKLNYRPAEQAA
ncbi:MAG: IclR family transcriptional regulator [Burkholderiales bacterium]|nr:IclR family transcriptional regulator [Burkholderiales bacterium]